MPEMELLKVHSDSRRDISVINNLLEDEKEFSIIELHKGKAVGGCMHENVEYVAVLSGKAVITIGEEDFFAEPGFCKTISAGTTHMFEGLTDCIICEWGITEKEKVNNKKDPEMLAMVNIINDR